MKIVTNSKLLRVLQLFKLQASWVEAMAFNETIYFKNEIVESILPHEGCHICQQREHGLINFLYIYFWRERNIHYSYKKFEKKAYKIKSVADLIKLYPEYPDVYNLIEKTLKR